MTAPAQDPARAMVSLGAALAALAALATAFTLVSGTASAQTKEAVAAEIRAEVAKPSLPPASVGRPLPLAACFNVGEPNTAGRPTPAYQLGAEGALARGHHVLPTFQTPYPDTPRADGSRRWPLVPEGYYRPAIDEARRLSLPLVFYGTQWEAELADRRGDLTVALGDNHWPLTPATDNTQAYYDAGRSWATSSRMRELVQWYPEAPRVFLLSNNEPPRLRWIEYQADPRFLARHPDCQNALAAARARYGDRALADSAELRACIRRRFGDDWQCLHRALLAGVRDGFRGTAWEGRLTLVGYDAFGPPHLGRYYTWAEDALTVLGERWDPWSAVWDGGVPSIYQHSWAWFINDFMRASVQAEAMNLERMLADTLTRNPEYWFEMAVWDGYQPGAGDDYGDKRRFYSARGQLASPERYGGWVQFGMWLLRPRVVREYRDYADTVEETGGHFDAVVAAVERVWRTPRLREFWQFGEPVPNPAQEHPYVLFHEPDGYPAGTRNFLLATPSHPWRRVGDGHYDIEVPVFALALRRGNEHLVYAHSAIAGQDGVTLELPGVFSIRERVSVGGSFFVVRDGRTVERFESAPLAGSIVFTNVAYGPALAPRSAAIAWNIPGRVDRLTFTVNLEKGSEQVEVKDCSILYSGPGQTNFVVPAIDLPAGHGGVVRAYAGGRLVARGWLTLASSRPALYTADSSGAGRPAGVVQHLKDGVITTDPIAGPNAAVRLVPGATTWIVIYGTGGYKAWWRDGARRFCRDEAPVVARVGDARFDLSRSPNYYGPWSANGQTVLGSEQINVVLTDAAGTPLPGVPLGDAVPLWLETTDCLNGTVRSNVLSVAITR